MVVPFYMVQSIFYAGINFNFFNTVNIDKYNPYKLKFFWGPPKFLKVRRGPVELKKFKKTRL